MIRIGFLHVLSPSFRSAVCLRLHDRLRRGRLLQAEELQGEDGEPAGRHAGQRGSRCAPRGQRGGRWNHLLTLVCLTVKRVLALL